MTDFWNKYHGTRQQLIDMMRDTPEFTPEEAVKESNLPLITLAEATTPKYINKMVRSNIQVVAVAETQYVTPTVITAEKQKAVGKNDTMYVGEVRDWTMNESNVQDILHLIDGGFKEEDIRKNSFRLMGIPNLEKYVRISKPAKEVVYKDAILQIGTFEPMIIEEKAFDNFKRIWSKQGLGFLVQEVSRKDKCVKVHCYYGSSTYNSKEMSLLIELLVELAKSLNLETKPQAEIDSLLRSWK